MQKCTIVRHTRLASLLLLRRPQPAMARPAPAPAEALLEANLDLEGDDAEEAGLQLEAWERAYEAERCGLCWPPAVV